MKHHDILYAAVNSEFGVEITCTDPVLLRCQLYTAIRKAKAEMNFDFNELSLHISPVNPQSNLWIRNVQKEKTSS